MSRKKRRKGEEEEENEGVGRMGKIGSRDQSKILDGCAGGKQMVGRCRESEGRKRRAVKLY